MRHWAGAVVASAAALGMLTCSLPTFAAEGALHNPRFVPGRLLVQAKAGVADEQFEATLAAHGARSAGKLHRLDVHVVMLPPGQSEKDTAAWLARHPNVKFAEVDELTAPDATVNDPLAPNEWHLGKIGAPKAWDATSGTGTIIAILDTGVDPSHPDLAPLLVAGWNFYDNNSNTADVYGHGTAVAGAAAAQLNNAIGVAGIAGRAQIMPIRVSDTTGLGYWSMMANGLTWAADHGARVANISYAVTQSSTIQSAAQYMRNKGGVVAVSAGNDGVAQSTAPTDTMITVGATDSNDALTSWSNSGAVVDVVAPGLNIYTTTKGGGYAYWWGTSFSSPIVAGVAALVKALRPDFTASQVESTLFSSAVDLGAAGKDNVYGNGRVDAGAAIAAVTAVAADTQPPTASITSPTGGTVTGSVSVAVNASDNLGVMRVDLKANGVLVASDTTPPFSFVWNSATLPDGTATLSAVAYDAAGNAGTSAPIAVNVANVSVDTTPPTVAITNPADGGKLGNGNLTVTATASDASGLASVKLSIDGTVVASGNAGTLSYKWNTRNVARGTHTITVWAQDMAGYQATRSINVSK